MARQPRFDKLRERKGVRAERRPSRNSVLAIMGLGKFDSDEVDLLGRPTSANRPRPVQGQHYQRPPLGWWHAQ